jgi:hypothetical protein
MDEMDRECCTHRREMQIQFYSYILKERDPLENLGVDGRIIFILSQRNRV